MTHMQTLLKPSWGSEPWILEGWNALTEAERKIVTERIDALFANGLPLELKHDKMPYIYAFSLLAQLEVLAIQVPLKFEDKMPSADLKQRMRIQLVDEVFHGLVFTRIVHELSAPYAYPPAYDEDVEKLCNFIRNEQCPKVAVILLNLVAEAWIEELFVAFADAGIATNVFKTILEDEHRHVSEADLYREIGLPSKAILQKKLLSLEIQLLQSLLFNYVYTNALVTLLGAEHVEKSLDVLEEKHTSQLKKLNLVPGEAWQFWMKSRAFLLPEFKAYAQKTREIPMSPLRQLFMTQWKAPTDPTMIGEFDIDITPLGFFEKKSPKIASTLLIMQAASRCLAREPLLRRFLSHHTLYESDEGFVGLVVKLPKCGDHLSLIILKNCHTFSMATLVKKVQQGIQIQAYCYKRREALANAFPECKVPVDKVIYEAATGIYPYPMPGTPMITVSNVGDVGYSRAKSPLRINEAFKFTLLTIAKKPHWDEEKQIFVPRDFLPVSASADHRVIDGDFPIVSCMREAFDEALERMHDTAVCEEEFKSIDQEQLVELIDNMIEIEPFAAYKVLTVLQTTWLDFIDIEHWANAFTKEQQALNNMLV